MKEIITEPTRLVCCERSHFQEHINWTFGYPQMFECVYCGKKYTVYQIEKGVKPSGAPA